MRMLLLVVLSVLAVACGGEESTTTTSGSASEAGDAALAGSDGEDVATEGAADLGTPSPPAEQPSDATDEADATPAPSDSTPASPPTTADATSPEVAAAGVGAEACPAIVELDVAAQALEDGSDVRFTDQFMAAAQRGGENLLAQVGSSPEIDAMLDDIAEARGTLETVGDGEYSDEQIERLYDLYDSVIDAGRGISQTYYPACAERTGDPQTYCAAAGQAVAQAQQEPAPGQFQDALQSIEESAAQAVEAAPDLQAATAAERFRQFSQTFAQVLAEVDFDPSLFSAQDQDALFEEAYPDAVTDLEQIVEANC